MPKICSNCGYECSDDDLFCPKCGYKLSEVNIDLNKIKETIDNVESFAPVSDIAVDNKKNNSFSTLTLNKYSSISDSGLFIFLIYMLVVLGLIVFITYFSLNLYNDKKIKYEYNKIMQNPSLIPKISDVNSYKELLSDFIKIQDFLFMYLKYSNDDIDTKDRVFAQFLKETEKLNYLSFDNMDNSDISSCSNVKTYSGARSCVSYLNRISSKSAISAIADYNNVHLYPNNKFLKRKYYRYLTNEYKKYISFKAKYNTPVSIGINLEISPKKLANKIYECEKLYNSVNDSDIKNALEITLYNDVKKFIFNPEIYATTTREMALKYKNAYNYYVYNKSNSMLTPIFMNILEKGKGYTEDNFKVDYPYKIRKNDFDTNVENSSFSDIFAQTRKGLLNSLDDVQFKYVYNSSSGSFENYSKNTILNDGSYLLSSADENNNVSIYSSSYSPFQELNVQNYAALFISGGRLYVYNQSRLQIFQVLFNGKIFVLRTLSPSDVYSVFPGINVINLDSYSTYNIVINKPNIAASYIIISKYSQGFEDYKLDALKGKIKTGKLPNMFSVNSDEDIYVSFHSANSNPDETSDNEPTYQFIIKTPGAKNIQTENMNDEYARYDRETAYANHNDLQNDESSSKPNIMPKIQTENDIKIPNIAPKIKLEPPVENE